MRTRLFKSESFRQAVLFVGLFVCTIAVLFTAVFLIIHQSFKATLLQDVGDDLSAIRAAYRINVKADQDREAAEVIDGRLFEPNGIDAYLLQRGSHRLAGNIPVMPMRAGTFAITIPGSAGGKSTSHMLMGRGEIVAPGVYAFVGRDVRQMEVAERAIFYAFFGVLLSSIVLAGLAGLFLSGKFIGRVDAVTSTCRNIMAGQMGERIPPAGRDDEFARLGGVVNAMLDRIQLLMESLSQVTNDIAHDMRTPLTHLRGKLERARDSATDVTAYAQAVEGAIADCDTLLATFAALLRIAEIEAGAKRAEFEPLDLAVLVNQAAEIYQPVMEDSAHGFVVKAESVAPSKGDRQLLLQMLANLLNNAIAHTPVGSSVTLSCLSEQGSAVIRVCDNGPGIAPAERGKVLRRFYRGEQSRTHPGSGLGLALVAAVADLHQAKLVLSDNNPGLCVSIRFGMTR